ncbi:MAG TPA: DUF1684 domain-containing protein, partial [Vicinamibacterales bacterium]|nr:DUF1684 domain-containing protein [Vicinamibacterales bacterium]
ATWLADQDALVSEVLPIVGIWPLAEGETAFGADADLPIVLPAAGTGRAGVFRRQGSTITLVPAAGAALRTADGKPIDQATEVSEEVWLGSLRMSIAGAPDGRLWVSASDEQHPAVKNPPTVEAYPLDPRWRIAARFDAFESPKPVRVPDVRGGTMDFTAMGQLVFRVNGQEMRLTALGEPGSEQFFVMFKDPTNQTTTYGGYRILNPAVVATGEWTVVDFNYASNPPCAYSKYTVCPLPPPENRLPVAVEAGLKRLPSAQGYSPS